MKEDFLHYLWKHKKFDLNTLKTEGGQEIQLLGTGQHNHLAGPDFFNARLSVGGQLWAGNVELHIKSSHWYAHGHEQDVAYDNVILHVVWENDMDVVGSNNQKIPTLVLKEYVHASLLNGYRKLFDNQNTTFINCEKDFAETPDLLMNNWLESLYLERLERKVNEIEALLATSQNDWEAVLFKMLAKNFGTKINGAAFESLAHTLPFAVLRKLANQENALEAVFMGKSDLLPKETSEKQVTNWKTDYKFLKLKHDLNEEMSVPIQFFRLRPVNFPTLRLSQLAVLYERERSLFSKILATSTLQDFYTLFNVQASQYWETHYNFGKNHKNRSKKLTTSFIDLLLINTVIPIKFAYGQSKNGEVGEELLALIQSISAEKNQVTDMFFSLRKMPRNALTTQALIQLKSNYCEPNLCLQCRIGHHLLSRQNTE